MSTIDLPQSGPDLELGPVFEFEEFDFSVTFAFADGTVDSIVSVTPRTANSGFTIETIGTDTVRVYGAIEDFFDQKQIEFLDYFDGEDYVLPKVYQTFNSFASVPSLGNPWDEVIKYIPDNRTEEDFFFDVVVEVTDTTTMETREEPAVFYIKVYNDYSLGRDQLLVYFTSA